MALGYSKHLAKAATTGARFETLGTSYNEDEAVT
jgi:hypothetical protein